MTHTADQPWICPTCGHFIVRADQVNCRTCEQATLMVLYAGSEQASAIRGAHR
jgi:hypothetical protein